MGEELNVRGTMLWNERGITIGGLMDTQKVL